MSDDDKTIKFPTLPALPGWVNLTEAAELVGITRQHAFKKVALAAAGKPGGWKTAHRIGKQNAYVVARQEVDELKATKTGTAGTNGATSDLLSRKKILYIDLDGTLVDLAARFEGIDPGVLAQFEGRYDEIPGAFAVAPPIPGAVEAFRSLAEHFDVFILSTAPWGNPSAWENKVEWVRLHLGFDSYSPAYKRLILSHRKDLNIGDFLVDDRPTKNGADRFQGEVIPFGSEKFPDWRATAEYLIQKARDTP